MKMELSDGNSFGGRSHLAAQRLLKRERTNQAGGVGVIKSQSGFYYR
jgi:hypothetical protein